MIFDKSYFTDIFFSVYIFFNHFVLCSLYLHSVHKSNIQIFLRMVGFSYFLDSQNHK